MNLKAVKENWIPIVHYAYPRAKVVLVGTKMDLREDMDPHNLVKVLRTSIQRKDGLNLRKRTKSVGYVECSAKSQDGIANVFYVVAKSASDNAARIKKSKNFKCEIL